MHVFNLILFINASICHLSDFWSICSAGNFRHLPLELTGWTILVPTLLPPGVCELCSLFAIFKVGPVCGFAYLHVFCMNVPFETAYICRLTDNLICPSTDILSFDRKSVLSCISPTCLLVKLPDCGEISPWLSQE